MSTAKNGIFFLRKISAILLFSANSLRVRFPSSSVAKSGLISLIRCSRNLQNAMDGLRIRENLLSSSFCASLRSNGSLYSFSTIITLPFLLQRSYFKSLHLPSGFSMSPHEYNIYSKYHIYKIISYIHNFSIRSSPRSSASQVKNRFFHEPLLNSQPSILGVRFPNQSI